MRPSANEMAVGRSRSSRPCAGDAEELLNDENSVPRVDKARAAWRLVDI